MGKIFYTNISNINIEDINLSMVSQERLDKANLICDNYKRIQLLVSYLLLKYAFKTYGIDISTYHFNFNNTKPFFKELTYHFNIHNQFQPLLHLQQP